MKMKYTRIVLLAAALFAVSCENLLFLESETKVTNNYLYSSKEGLQRAIAGLYIYERDNFALSTDENPILYLVQMMDTNTDLLFFRAGNCADIARLNTMTSNSEGVEAYWKEHYGIIGKANEIIAAAEELGLDDPVVKSVWGEAKLFRGRAYFELYQRFGRLYLNTEPTTWANLDRRYSPATKEEVFSLIKTDLDDAISSLSWQLPTEGGKTMYGRFTKALAKHIRAQVAMWEEDWDEAITQCESIFTEGKTWWDLLPKAENVFNTENKRSKEVLYALQFSKNLGGGGTVNGTNLVGHLISVNTVTEYRSIAGCTSESAQGGYGFGRQGPNSYLLSLYDQAKDNRYEGLFRHWFYYNVQGGPNYGNVIPRGGDEYIYARYTHPMTIKHADFWTNQDQPDRHSSFNDLIVYRLAETYLMASEAYFHKEGGISTKAIEYYNKTWERAGNDHFDGPLTLDILLEEYARELCFEGVRWPLLKRLGLLADRCIAHAGDTMADEPLLDQDYAHAREFFVRGKHENWPIPANQILLMGAENFPQNEGWN